MSRPRSALIRELREEIDCDALIGRPFFTSLDTTYHVALLLKCGPNPFNGPEFSDPSLGKYAIVRVPLAKAITPEFRSAALHRDRLLDQVCKAVLAEGQRLKALTY